MEPIIWHIHCPEKPFLTVHPLFVPFLMGTLILMKDMLKLFDSPDDLQSKLVAWFRWVPWHINHCRLFNAKSSLYLYIYQIYMIWFSFFFSGKSTIVGYLMPNPIYSYILNIYDLVWSGFMAYQPL